MTGMDPGPPGPDPAPAGPGLPVPDDKRPTKPTSPDEPSGESD